MAIEDDDDRAAFFDTDDFGQSVTWTRASVAQPAFAAIFSHAAMPFELGESAATIDRVAQLLCRESDLPAGAAEGDPVAIAGQASSFTCRSILPTGDGMARVTLQKV